MATSGDGNGKVIRIGFVPEHYLLPLHLAKSSFPFPVEYIPFPQGTGHMITSLKEDSIDIAIGLTEGWIAGLLKQQPQNQGDSTAAKSQKPDYYLVGKWVKNPLRWSIITGRDRKDINSVADLREHNRVGVSRMGSGSHIMSFVLAQQQGWLTRTSNATLSGEESEGGESEKSNKNHLEFVPLGALKDLIAGVRNSVDNPNNNTGEDAKEKEKEKEKENTGAAAAADFFMWEHFTTKPYFEGEDSPLKWIGEIYTPWPSWHIAANARTFGPASGFDSGFGSSDKNKTGLRREEEEETDRGDVEHHLRTHPILDQIFTTLDHGIGLFNDDTENAVRLLGRPERSHCHYDEADAREWLKKVEFFHPALPSEEEEEKEELSSSEEKKKKKKSSKGTKGVQATVVNDVITVLQTAGVLDQTVQWNRDVARKIGIFDF